MVYLCLVIAQTAAAYLSHHIELDKLRLAAELQPWDAEYEYRLGRYFLIVTQRADTAATHFRRALALNAHSGTYWLDLAAASNLLRDDQNQRQALEQGVAADPTSPAVAWQAANFYLTRNETARSLAEFRVVLASDPSRFFVALRQCERFADVDTILRTVMPSDPQPYYILLDDIMLKKRTADAEKVWAQLAQLHRPVDRSQIFAFIHYLIDQREVEQASRVWQQAAPLAGLLGYEPSGENLVINGDFSSEILDGGFGWVHQSSPNVILALDPTQSHSGNQSLSVTFNGPAVEDAGIWQMVPVKPNTSYDFSANFKSETMEGAGGPRLVIEDGYTGSLFFSSDDLKHAEVWKAVDGSFTTGTDTKLVVVRIRRVPAGSPIRGKLWIDGVKLSPRELPHAN